MARSGSPMVFALVVALLGCSRRPPGNDTELVASAALGGGQIFGNGLPDRTVILTYDDGPDEHTLELAHFLADSGVHVTFFVNGRRICKVFAADGTCTTPMDTRPCDGGDSQAPVASPRYYPESLLDEVISLGHRIGNHTQDHCTLTKETNADDLIWEIQTTQDIVDRHVCDNVYLFRAPYGEWNGATAARLQSAPKLARLRGPINWDIDGEDWGCWQKGTSPEACTSKYMKILTSQDRQNGIFLMHDRPEFNVGYEGPLLMARILIPRLKDEGFKLATLEDLLKLPPRTPGSGCTPPLGDAGPAAPLPDGSLSPPVEAGPPTSDTGAPPPLETPGTAPPPPAAPGSAIDAAAGSPPDDGLPPAPPTAGSSAPGRGGCAVTRAVAPRPGLTVIVAVVALALRRRAARRSAPPA